jgi:DNA-binding NarL/FixJ family response regulator
MLANGIHEDAPRREVSLPRLRVLVADDHQAMLDHLVRLIARDYDVVAAVHDGPSVISAATQLGPDVLVLDIGMPGMSGIAAASHLMASGETPKVVFVTMHHDREFVQEAQALGVVGFVTKDRLVTDLLQAIRKVLAGEPFVSPSVSH